MLFLVVLLQLGAAACVVPDEEPESVAEPLTVPVPAVGKFAILAAQSIDLGDVSAVRGGSLGVAPGMGGPGTITGGIGAQVGVGQLLLAQRVSLGDAASAGELGADTVVTGNGTTTGPRSPYVAPPAAPRTGPVAPGTQAVVVNRGATRSLQAGRHGAVTVNGRLILEGGLFELQSLRLGLGAQLLALNPATVRIAGGMSVSPFSLISPNGNSPAGHLRFIVAGALDNVGNSVLLGPAVQMTALVVARHNVVATGLLLFRGAIAATSVVLGPGALVDFDTGFGCGADAGCDEGNVCTLDACVDARCVRSDAPRGAPCDDANVCTDRDYCQAGACVPGTPLVAEHTSPLADPAGLIAAPDGSLWYFNAESARGAADGKLARLQPGSAAITTFETGRRLLDLQNGPDGHLWAAGRLPSPTTSGGLSTLLRITPAGVVASELRGLPADVITAGSDGNLWFASDIAGIGLAGAIRPADGLVTAILFVGNAPRSMTAGPDGNVWAALSSGGSARTPRIARITPASALTEFPVASGGNLNQIIRGGDGNLWFSDDGENQIVRITPAGVTTRFPIPTGDSGAHGVAAGPDGKIWFTARKANRIGRLDPASGAIEELACIPTASSGPTSIAAASDGRLWFTQPGAGKVASIYVPGSSPAPPGP